MDFRKIIESGAKKAGTARKLADYIGVTESTISSAKSHGRGLPDAACLKLALLLDLDFGKVIAARNEWTAKSEEEREFWHPLANAAGIVGICLFIVSSLCVPSPAQAAPILDKAGPALCIMSNAGRKIMRMAWAIVSIAFGNCRAAFDNFYFVDHTAHA